VTNPRNRREELGLTQPVAAARAEVSLETWQQWEEDPTSVSADAREKCEHVIHTEAFRIERAEQVARFEQAWKGCSYLTPRQASAIANVLALWSYNIDQWLQGQSQHPLHEVGPFESIDRRAMIYINDNKAWAAKAQERCDALSEEIERGVLPFTRDGCFFDELLIGAALPVAEAILAALPEVFEDIPARAKPGDQDGDELQISDDDWNAVSDTFIDRCRWEAWQVPLYRDHPLLTEILAAIHPYVWFDPPENSDAEYEEDLRSSGLVEGEDEQAMSPAD
jgi:transcriptional regulator with XRE-family HTH domain